MRGDLAFIYFLISAVAPHLNEVLCVDHREVDKSECVLSRDLMDVSVHTHTGVRIVVAFLFGEPLLKMEESGSLYLVVHSCNH